MYDDAVKGLFAVGNLMSGSSKIKSEVYELGLVDILFNIHKEDKLNMDNYGSAYSFAVKDFVWLISVLLERYQGKIRNQICLKDVVIFTFFFFLFQWELV